MKMINEKLTPTFWAILALCVVQIALFTIGRVLDAPPKKNLWDSENWKKECYECREKIHHRASKCPHCHSDVSSID